MGHTYNNNCYTFHTTFKALVWLEAETACQAQGGHLVSVMSQEEMTFIHYLLTSRWRTEESSTYIGKDINIVLNIFKDMTHCLAEAVGVKYS